MLPHPAGATELAQLFAALGNPMSYTQLVDVMQKYDKDESGQIEFSEFLLMFRDNLLELQVCVCVCACVCACVIGTKVQHQQVVLERNTDPFHVCKESTVPNTAVCIQRERSKGCHLTLRHFVVSVNGVMIALRIVHHAMIGMACAVPRRTCGATWRAGPRQVPAARHCWTTQRVTCPSSSVRRWAEAELRLPTLM